MLGSVTLTITCKDKTGIVASVTGFLCKQNANIISLDQHSTDPEGGQFFMRVTFVVPHEENLVTAFEETVARLFDMKWFMHPFSKRKRLAILCSKEEHALLDLLWSWQQGHLNADIPLVISNHASVEKNIAHFETDFVHIPNHHSIREHAEKSMLARLKDYNIDCVVLARYMQILSPHFVSHYPQALINIHHSFLPAFVGANPYQQALDRGVKLIGATAHYVSEVLDDGPIIDQDTQHISHRLTLRDLKILGQTIEKTVLTRAVKYHVEDRVIVHENKTIIF